MISTGFSVYWINNKVRSVTLVQLLSVQNKSLIPYILQDTFSILSLYVQLTPREHPTLFTCFYIPGRDNKSPSCHFYPVYVS